MKDWIYGLIIFFAFTSGLVYQVLSIANNWNPWIVIIAWAVVYLVALLIKSVDEKRKVK